MKISEEMLQIIKDTHIQHLTCWENTLNEIYVGRGHLLLKEIPKITRKESELFFKKDIRKVERIANNLLKGINNIPQNHFDVFCSLLFDFEKKYILNSSFYKLYMQGLREQAGERIMVWSRKQGMLIRTLRFRRTIDKQIYINNDYKIHKNKVQL